MVLMPTKLFGTSGIRGPADTLFTSNFCTKLGYVFGSWLTSKGKSGYVAVGMDPRESSPRIKQNIIRGLTAAGWEIIDQGVLPTPALTYFCKQTSSIGGAVMITGSHITANLNGVKLLINGEEVTKEHEQEIEKLFSSLPTPQNKFIDPAIEHRTTAADLYLEMLHGLADTPYPGWKIVLDTANGTQTEIFKQLFSDLNLDFICTGDCDLQSPTFIPRDTEVQSAFTDLIRDVLGNHADFGIGFDADGDRVIFVDDQGRYIPGDYSCSLIAKYSDSSSIVTPISSSSVVDHLDKQVYRTKVGSTHVVAKMKEVGATFGFEANGGGISAEIFYGRDGGSTAIKILNLLKKHRLKLSQAYDQFPSYYLFRDKVDCPTQLFDQIYSRIREKYMSHPLDDLDGLKIDLGNNDWILFRASGNAPEFRVFTQSSNKHQAQKLGTEGLDYVKSIIHPSTHNPDPNPNLDSLNILSSLQSLPDQCEQVLSDISTLSLPTSFSKVHNIVISGMGGSALGGRILTHLERQILKIPLLVSTEYHLPNFVNKNSLVVVSSYSGNTQESLSSLAEARSRGAQIFIITTGGKLAEIATQFDFPAYIINPQHNPSSQPRMGLGYAIIALVSLLTRGKLIHTPEYLDLLPDFLRQQQKDLPGRILSLAQSLVGKIPVILASEHLKGAAHDLKNQFNENAKTFAAFFDLPEANHHLLEGLTFPHTNSGNLSFLIIKSKMYHPEILRRYEITQHIIHKHHIPALSLIAEGNTSLFETMDIVQSGAYLAYHLALLNHIDPGPIPWVDYFKDQISKNVS